MAEKKPRVTVAEQACDTQRTHEPRLELSVIIPAYDEAARLPAFLDSVIRYCREHHASSEIIVVDDGSCDSTAELALQRGVRVIVHDANHGKGAAVRTGMLAARGRLRLFVDADGATGIDSLPALLNAARAGADLAIGSREGSHMRVECGRMRRFLGRWFNRVVRMGSVSGIRDTQCGFKLFATPAALRLFDVVQEDGYAFDVELLLLAQKRNLRVEEVFVDWTEIPGSKVNLFRDGIRMLKAVRRIRRRSRRGEYQDARTRRTPATEQTA